MSDSLATRPLNRPSPLFPFSRAMSAARGPFMYWANGMVLNLSLL